MSDYVPSGFCPRCGYRTDAGTCAECGRRVTRPWQTHPRIVRRRRRLIGGALLCGLAAAGWWFGPTLAARHTPAGALVWIWETDLAGAEWAERVMRARLATAFSGADWDIPAVRQAIAESREAPGEHDWIGGYGRAMPWLLGGSMLFLGKDHAAWGSAGMMQRGNGIAGDVKTFDGQTLRLDLPADRRLLRWSRRLPPYLGMDSDLMLVRWGDWRYLVAKEDLMDFCNDVNGGEPLHEYHLTRGPPNHTQGDLARGRPRGRRKPELPAPYGSYILQNPVDAVVVKAAEAELTARGPIARLVEVARKDGLETYVWDLDWL